jgi:hypothetical protein
MKRREKNRTCVCWLVGATLFSASTVHGQVLDGDQIQMLLGQAQQIEQCMAEANNSATQDLLQRGERISVEIENLCKAGKRDAAQAMALAFGREMADSPAMASLQQCAGALGALLPAALASLQGNAADAVQVCDVQ